MRQAVARPIIEELLAHVVERRAWTTEPSSVPARDYTDHEHLALEQRVLFRRPLVAALSPDLPGPGSVFTTDLAGLPCLLTRNDDGVVAAFANVCAHRGARVVASARHCQRRLTCPYHAWSYDLAGRLVGVPDRASFPDVDIGSPGLRSLPVLEEHGVIWIVADPAAHQGRAVLPPDPELGAIADDLDAFAPTRHRWWRTHRFELDFNWKLVVDTFLEPYHFASLHRDTVGPLFVPNLCWADRHGVHVREVLPRRTISDLVGTDPSTWDVVAHTALVYVLFPNTVFVVQMDHIETWRVEPLGTDPSRSVCLLNFYVPDEPATDRSEQHWERNWRLTIDTVIHEDFHAMAGVQRGLASGALDALRVGANEPALGMYHTALAEVLGRDPTARPALP
jgi:phenylpropionate dioxygenase-like ring-hydroxylating dioxygenase large terminal subunit